MGILDNLGQIKKLDSANMLQNLMDFPDQIEAAWQSAEKLALPTHYLKIKNVVILGMGGSAIGGDLCVGLSLYNSKVPIIIHRDYDLPAFVDHDSLVIAVSYSGNTEETVSGFQAAGEKGAKMLAISSGGDLAPICRKYRAPLLEINYGAQPRAALGYLLTPILGILSRLGILAISRGEIETAIQLLKGLDSKIRPEVPTAKNIAKQLANKLYDRIAIIIGSGALKVAARRWKTQINENAKSAVWAEELPELCHNFIVGLDFPKRLKDKIFVVVLQSKYDHPRNKIRQSVVFQILQQKSIPYEPILMHPSDSALDEMLSAIYLGDYVSYYLAIANGLDPTPIKSIELLKERLAGTK